jgi:hypothetical protein
MKKLFVIIMLLATMDLYAPGLNDLVIGRPEPVNIFDRLIYAVNQVETSGERLAFNFEERARGPLQIRPIRLNDYNRRTGKNYSELDCYSFSISREIFLYYTAGRSFEAVAKSWNGSGPMTIEYWNKVKRHL